MDNRFDASHQLFSIFVGRIDSESFMWLVFTVSHTVASYAVKSGERNLSFLAVALEWETESCLRQILKAVYIRSTAQCTWIVVFHIFKESQTHLRSGFGFISFQTTVAETLWALMSVHTYFHTAYECNHLPEAEWVFVDLWVDLHASE